MCKLRMCQKFSNLQIVNSCILNFSGEKTNFAIFIQSFLKQYQKTKYLEERMIPNNFFSKTESKLHETV